MRKNIFRIITSFLLGFILVIGLNIEDAEALTNVGVDINQDTTINDDVVILENESITVSRGMTLTVNGNLYILGTLTNYGKVIVSKDLDCLSYNGFMTAGSYSNGIFYNYGRVKVNSLNVTDDWMSNLDTTQIQEFEPADPLVDEFVKSVNALPEHFEHGSIDAIYAANRDYQDLTNEQKNKSKVIQAYQKLETLNQEEERVNRCELLLKSLPSVDDVQLSDKAAVQNARQSYDTLDTFLQKSIDQSYINTLENDEDKLKTLESDQSKVNEVTAKIQAIDTNNSATLKAQYTAAKETYDALSDGQKKLVSSDVVNKLTTAKAKIDALDKQAQDDQNKAKEVTTIINDIDTNNTATLKTQYTAAKEAYDALTDTQNKLVSSDVVNKLTTAKAKIDALDKQAQDDQNKANEATAKINGIDTNNTATLKAQYTAAKEAYDALSDAQKKLVTADVSAKLEQAKNVLDQEEAKATENKDANKNTTETNKQINSQPQPNNQISQIKNDVPVAHDQASQTPVATNTQTNNKPVTTQSKPTNAAKNVNKIQKKTKKIVLTVVKMKKVKVGKKSFTVTWKKVKSAKKYQVAYKVAGGKWKIKTVSKLKYKAMKLKSKKKYTVRVRAINGKIKGKWSKTKNVRVK